MIKTRTMEAIQNVTGYTKKEKYKRIQNSTPVNLTGQPRVGVLIKSSHGCWGRTGVVGEGVMFLGAFLRPLHRCKIGDTYKNIIKKS